MVGTSYHPLAQYGRMDDTMMAHVTPGEIVVPKPVLDANPQLAEHIYRAIRNAGANPGQYEVGEDMSINPETGHPEFGFGGFFKKIFKRVAPAAIGFIPGIGPLAAAAAGAGIGALGGGGLKGALMGGLSGYGGASLAGGLRAAGSIPGAGIMGPVRGSVLGGLKNIAGGVPGAFGAATGGFGTTAGKLFQAAQFGAGFLGQKQSPGPGFMGTPDGSARQAGVFKRPNELARPSALNELAAFTPEQERSAIATRGINVGLGSEEKNYYKNLLQRSLIGEGNKIAPDNPNFLMPIESQYFSRSGYDTSTPRRFLTGLGSY